MDVDPSILVTMLNPLETDGHLSRESDADDRRRHVVTIHPNAGSSSSNRRSATPKTSSSQAGLTNTQRAPSTAPPSSAISSRPGPTQAAPLPRRLRAA